MSANRFDISKLAAVLGLAGALMAPAPALADGSGGASAPSSGSASQSSPGSPGAAETTGAVGPIGLQADAAALLGRMLRLHGSLGSGSAGRQLAIERYDAASGRWVAAATTTADNAGNYTAVWRTDQVGVQHLRVRDTGASSRAQSSNGGPTVDVTVFRPQYATWYGPGFYGQRTACGVLLTHRTLGVAHRTLPCGTSVEILYGGRTITVPVIDRGPYGGRAKWDLSQATAQALGFDGNALVGVVRAPHPSSATAARRAR